MKHNLPQPIRRVKTIMGWSVFVLLIVTQWEARPWALFALLFFSLFYTWQLLDFYNQPRFWIVPILWGAALNGLAIFANGGRMPVLGRTEVNRWWQPLTEKSHLAFLCDIYWKCSIGDFIVLLGILGGLIVSLIGVMRNKTKAT